MTTWKYWNGLLDIYLRLACIWNSEPEFRLDLSVYSGAYVLS